MAFVVAAIQGNGAGSDSLITTPILVAHIGNDQSPILYVGIQDHLRTEFLLIRCYLELLYGRNSQISISQYNMYMKCNDFFPQLVGKRAHTSPRFAQRFFDPLIFDKLGSVPEGNSLHHQTSCLAPSWNGIRCPQSCQ